MKLTEKKLRRIVREELLAEKRRVAMGSEGGYVELSKDDRTGQVLMDVGSGGRGAGETRIRLDPGEAQNLANNLDRMGL
jgi:hypothetical protein